METNINVRSFDSHLTPNDFKIISRYPISVVLDNLRSAFNVGSIIRTADCALIDKVYLCGITAHPPHKKLDKTSLGALPYVPCEYNENIHDVITGLKDRGIHIIALELTDKSNVIWQNNIPLPVALVLGNEAMGVSPPILDLADDIVEIPMFGYKNSLNVAVAFGIVVYEIHRQYWHQMSKKSRIRGNPESIRPSSNKEN